jgi:hypothetical protein
MKHKPTQTRSSGRDKGKNVAPQTAKTTGKTTEMKHMNEAVPTTVPITTAIAEAAPAAPPAIPDEILPESLGDIVEAMAQSKGRVEQLQGELEAERQRGQRLYTKFETMKNEYKLTFEGSDEEETDGRRKFSPEKNLKISAVRIISWAKEKGLEESAAKQRALTKTAERAKKKYNIQRLPPILERYIEINTPRVYSGEALLEVTESSTANAA